jgi:hypothetical protein
MSSQYSHEESVRLSQRACHLLTGYLSSATKITFDDSSSDEETVLLAPNKIVAIDVAKLIEEIFGPDCDYEEEEEVEVDYYQQSKRLLEFYETQCPRSTAIEAIRKNREHRCGEDYGAGVPCDNTDCYRDYNDDYFQRVFVEEGLYQRLCPDCIPEEEEEQEQEEDQDQEHKDKRVKIIPDNDV